MGGRNGARRIGATSPAARKGGPGSTRFSKAAASTSSPSATGRRSRRPKSPGRERAAPAKNSPPSPTCWAREGRHRSEEHTSELQSLMRSSYAVFCLKKQKQKPKQDHIRHKNKNT